jgi:4-oxalomesaconate tautomerase
MKPSSQTAVPCMLMRGGTSKGPFYKADDLPSDTALRDKVLLAAMGSPDKRQIDGLGGAHPLTSKVGIVSQSSVPGVALDFLFAQLQPCEPIYHKTIITVKRKLTYFIFIKRILYIL